MRQFAEVVAEYLLIKVAEQMKWLDADIGSLQSTLQQTPEIFESVGVDLSMNISLGMIDNLMSIVSRQESIRAEVVRINRSSSGNMFADFSDDCVFLAVSNDAGTDFSTPFQHAEYGGLALHATGDDTAAANVNVHESGSATDEGLVYFNLTATTTHLEEGTSLHCQADAVKHKPRRLLGNAKHAANFIRTNTVLAVGDHPDSYQPFVQSDWGIFKDRPHLHRKLPMMMDSFALPLALVLKEYDIISFAGRTDDYTIRPAYVDHKLEAVVRIVEVDNGLLESFRLGVHSVSHEPNIPSGA